MEEEEDHDRNKITVGIVWVNLMVVLRPDVVRRRSIRGETEVVEDGGRTINYAVVGVGKMYIYIKIIGLESVFRTVLLPWSLRVVAVGPVLHRHADAVRT